MNKTVSKLTGNRTENIKITSATGKNAKVRDKEYYIRDSELSGFYIRVNPKSKPSYGVGARLNGSGSYKTRNIGSVFLYSEKEAREIAKEWIKFIKAGVDPLEVKRSRQDQSQNLLELLEQYLAVKELKEKTAKDYRNGLGSAMLSRLANKPINEITQTQLITWFNKNKKDKPRQTDKLFNIIKTILEYAKSKGYVENNVASSAVLGIKRPKSKDKKDSYINIENQLPAFMSSIIDLREEMTPSIRDWLILTLQYGLRANEGFRLKWSDLNPKQRIFTITQTKNDRPLTLPMTELALCLFHWRKKEDKNRHKVWVFPNRYGTDHLVEPRKQLNKVIKLTRKKLGDKKFYFSPHDLRRTFSNLLLKNKVPTDTISMLLNHTDKTVTQKYLPHVYDEQKEILNKVAKELDYALDTFNKNGEGELFAMYGNFDYVQPHEPVKAKQDPLKKFEW